MKRIAPLMLALAIILSACNMPAEETSPDIATAAALTVEAALNVAPLASPVVVATQPVSEAESASDSQPLASFEDVTNCRTGPGVNYQRITQIPPLVSVEIIGFFPPNYWVVNTDAGPCWVAGEFVTPSGNVAVVPTVTAPPTPQGGTPAEPTFTNNGWNYFCNADGKAEITLSWNDKATNETGYRVIRNGEPVAELPENSTTFSETIELTSGQSVSYQIQAYNSVGQSTSRTATMSCP